MINTLISFNLVIFYAIINIKDDEKNGDKHDKHN